MKVQKDVEEDNSAAQGKLSTAKFGAGKYGEILSKTINSTQTELSSKTRFIAFSDKFSASSLNYATLDSKVEAKDPGEAHVDSNVTILKKNEHNDTISLSVLEDGLQEIDLITLSIENVKSSIQIRIFASLSEIWSTFSLNKKAHGLN